MKRLNKSGLERGFTIVEFIIATTVFSVILLVFSAAFTRIGQLFYKGVVTSKTQEASRTLMDEISRNIQFSSGTITTGNPLCIGGTHYTITLNSQVTASTHALQRTSSVGGAACVPDSSAPELLPENMRLLDFSVSPSVASPELYDVIVTVAYGDSDLVDSINKNCKSTAGSQFCAVSSLHTTVLRRIQ